MFGTLVNMLAISAGSLAGLFFKGGIPANCQRTVIQALGLAVILKGIVIL